ncbi:MAG: adenylate/guanylate cyclase domain-containing protein [Bacteroidota bacterium]
MKISPANRRKLKSILVVTFAWLLIGQASVFYNALTVEAYHEYDDNFDIGSSILTNIFASIIAGLVGGYLLVVVLKDRFKTKPLWYSIVAHILSIVALIVAVSSIASIFFNSLTLDKAFFDPLVLKEAINFITSFGFLQIMVIWTTVTALTVVALQINDKYGHGVLFDLLLGKYHTPKQETRIFMFLDIKSSTGIAEKLGHEKYFNLLNEFFEDITTAIINSEGEIYQYVGDEIVVTWRMEEGLRDANCLKCFFETEKIIAKLSEKYLDQYGLTPDFKAALHYGEVTTGEVGTVKKDIIFTGDVLNTTSRMQELCNKFGVNLLISEKLLDKLSYEDMFDVVELGDIELRGKQQKIKLFCAKVKGSSAPVANQSVDVLSAN